MSKTLLVQLSRAQPSKPKAKIDPQRQAMIEKRKKSKLEKELKRLSKASRILKPVEEIDGTPKLRREARSGMRDREKTSFSVEEMEEQVLLDKEWSRSRMRLHRDEMMILKRVFRAQEKALQKLREESEELYQQAIQTDDTLIPYTFKGPTITPPIKDFDAVDGEYFDRTNYFDKTKS